MDDDVSVRVATTTHWIENLHPYVYMTLGNWT
jgi:hypothetical protein